jgi:predicted transcriptional regulator of viral defense system
MKYIDFYESLKDFTLFTVNDIRQIDSRFYRSRLNEWQKKGYIRKLISGCYIFSNLTLNESVLFEIANRIYSPSYISFEMALAYYHLIPESVYEITSVSTRRTYRFQTDIAEFNYRTLKSELFFGYKLVQYNNKSFKIAGIEKAILDYFYINTHLENNDDFIDLRINRDSFYNQVNEERLNQYLDRFSKKALSKRVHAFLKFLLTIS